MLRVDMFVNSGFNEDYDLLLNPSVGSSYCSFYSIPMGMDCYERTKMCYYLSNSTCKPRTHGREHIHSHV